MPQRETVAMQMLDHGALADAGRERLREVLGDATVEDPDDTGLFTISLAAGTHEEALERVWDAAAAAGADDHVAFAEHPELPEHGRHRAARPMA
jgi:hypothetical protein